MTRRNSFLVAAGFVLLLGVSAAVVFLVRTSAGPSAWPTVRIGYLPIAAELPLFVAIERGFFAEAGIDFQLTRLASSNEMGNAATADRIDILAGAASNVVFDIGHVSGKRHLVFALNPYSNTPGNVTDHLIARVGSGIRSLRDLRGKKVASFPGSVNRMFTYLILEKHGIPRDSYTYIELLPRDWEPSLQAAAVDVVSALEPQATQILRDSVGYSIFAGFYADLMPDVPLSAHWIAADYYARADKGQLAAFLNAYEKAIEFCREHEQDAKAYLVKYANVREDIIGQVNLSPWQRLSEINLDRFQSYIDLLAANGALLARVDIHDYRLPDPRRQ